MPRNEKEIREEIITTTNEYMHVLECYPASIQVNQPRAVMQIFAKTKLDALYWMLREERPRYKCDDKTKMDW